MPVSILLCGYPKSDFFLSDFCKEIASRSSFFCWIKYIACFNKNVCEVDSVLSKLISNIENF